MLARLREAGPVVVGRDVSAALPAPRVVWLMLPAGTTTGGDALSAAVCLRLGNPESDLAARHASLP